MWSLLSQVKLPGAAEGPRRPRRCRSADGPWRLVLSTAPERTGAPMRSPGRFFRGGTGLPNRCPAASFFIKKKGRTPTRTQAFREHPLQGGGPSGRESRRLKRMMCETRSRAASHQGRLSGVHGLGATRCSAVSCETGHPERVVVNCADPSPTFLAARRRRV